MSTVAGVLHRQAQGSHTPWERAHLDDPAHQFDADIANLEDGSLAMHLQLCRKAVRMRANSSSMPNGLVT